MIKWILILLAVWGFLMLAVRYAPSLYGTGFALGGYHVPWIIVGGAIVIVLGARLKGK